MNIDNLLTNGWKLKKVGNNIYYLVHNEKCTNWTHTWKKQYYNDMIVYVPDWSRGMHLCEYKDS